MAFWDTLQNTVKAEIDLKMEQGYDVEEFQKAFAKAGEDEGALRAVYENLAKAERQRNYPYLEPNEFEEIIRDHRFPEDTVLTNQETLYEKSISEKYKSILSPFCSVCLDLFFLFHYLGVNIG